jgi:hypothetical protein
LAQAVLAGARRQRNDGGGRIQAVHGRLAARDKEVRRKGARLEQDARARARRPVKGHKQRVQVRRQRRRHGHLVQLGAHQRGHAGCLRSGDRRGGRRGG